MCECVGARLFSAGGVRFVASRRWDLLLLCSLSLQLRADHLLSFALSVRHHHLDKVTKPSSSSSPLLIATQFTLTRIHTHIHTTPMLSFSVSESLLLSTEQWMKTTRDEQRAKQSQLISTARKSQPVNLVRDQDKAHITFLHIHM